MYKLILFLGICSAFASGSKLPVHTEDNKNIIGCYYQSWAVHRKSEEKFDIEDIDVSLCTHLIYSFVGLGADASVRLLDADVDIKTNGFKRFNDLRKKNTQLKTLVSMGGWNEGSDNYTKVVNDPILREKLVNNVVDFLIKYDFNGFDLDWEYPSQRGGIPSDKKNFVVLLKALREKLDKHNFILTVAVGAGENTVKISYDVKGISKYVHFLNLMTYDFHGTYDTDKKVGHNTPMYPSKQEDAEGRKLNIDYVVNYWLKEGAPPRKIILGTAFYGHSYALANTKKIGRGATFTGEGKIDATYYTVCQLAKNPKWKHIYDDEQKVPYLYKDGEIIAYDDVESIKLKAEYAKKMNLGGAMMWSVDQDDFKGKCGEKNPLLKTLNKVLRN